mmetsp:Transcript_6106/g.22408  ORF Transcript_6106/g.22408 Transcript_6106/m.22408 type:complete len:241 (-) Transcript_6106:18-740(-)
MAAVSPTAGAAPTTSWRGRAQRMVAGAKPRRPGAMAMAPLHRQLPQARLRQQLPRPPPLRPRGRRAQQPRQDPPRLDEGRRPLAPAVCVCSGSSSSSSSSWRWTRRCAWTWRCTRCPSGSCPRARWSGRAAPCCAACCVACSPCSSPRFSTTSPAGRTTSGAPPSTEPNAKPTTPPTRRRCAAPRRWRRPSSATAAREGAFRLVPQRQRSPAVCTIARTTAPSAPASLGAVPHKPASTSR